jgi:DNA-binding CsgD family transcriptional regulator/PAS domain-containing protein
MRSATKKTELELIAAIYDAALDSDKWNSVLKILAGQLRTQGIFLLNADYMDQRAGVAHTFGFEARMLDEYTSHWHFQDPGRNLVLGVPVGALVATQNYYSNSAWERTEYYNEFGARFGMYYQLGIKLADDQSRTAFVGCNRAKSDGPFESRNLKLVAELGPHFVRSFQIGRMVTRSALERDLLASLLERTDVGVVVLDEAGRVFALNARAESRLSTSGAMAIRDGRLTLRDTRQQERLRSLIVGCAGTARGAGTCPGDSIVAPSSSGGETLVLHVIPLPLGEPGPRRGFVGVFIHAGMEAPHVNETVLMALFGLTPSEARVAARIAEGRSPEQIATEGAVSLHTVRAQLRSVYEKLGVNRQAEVVLRVLSSPAAMRSMNGD